MNLLGTLRAQPLGTSFVIQRLSALWGRIERAGTNPLYRRRTVAHATLNVWLLRTMQFAYAMSVDSEAGLSCNSAGETVTTTFAIAHRKSPMEFCAPAFCKSRRR